MSYYKVLNVERDATEQVMVMDDQIWKWHSSFFDDFKCLVETSFGWKHIYIVLNTSGNQEGVSETCP